VIVACAGKIFYESFGKSFGEIVLGKYLMEPIIAGVEIFTNGILWRGWKTIAHERGLGSVDNPCLVNLDITKGCDRMVERSRGHMGHIEGIFRDLFSWVILTKDFSGKWSPSDTRDTVLVAISDFTPEMLGQN